MLGKAAIAGRVCSSILGLAFTHNFCNHLFAPFVNLILCIMYLFIRTFRIITSNCPSKYDKIVLFQSLNCFYDSLMKCRKSVRSDFFNLDMMASSDIGIRGLDYGAQNTTNKKKANSLWEQWKKAVHQIFRAREFQRKQQGHLHDYIYAQTITRLLK